MRGLAARITPRCPSRLRGRDADHLWTGPSKPQVAFVQACIALGRLKPAAKAVRALGLQEEFPDVEVRRACAFVCHL